MFNRLIDPLETSSFFVFGARGTGKSTLLKERYLGKRSFYINLLDPELEYRYSLDPNLLLREVAALKQKPKWVVIDEIQKVPKLLELVHWMIEDQKQKFILTGSSARKLKRGAANLLAGRANVYNLFPLTFAELGDVESLDEHLRWGSLPHIFTLKTEREKKSYLNAYIQTYFAEEIRSEQIIRKLDPFRAFLPILGQVSGKIVNHANIGKEVGVSTATIQSYFQIVEDTLLGFYLPAFHVLIRKSQLSSPKFYIFDTGVKKALEQSLDQKVLPRTSVYGELFESFIINEIQRLNSYFERDFRFSYFATKNGVEVDLVLSKASQHSLVEIKSSQRIDMNEVKRLSALGEEVPNLKKCFYLSQDPIPQTIKQVECMHWKQFLKNFAQLLK
jgi:predicted AAA+ superfamily ATPase